VRIRAIEPDEEEAEDTYRRGLIVDSSHGQAPGHDGMEDKARLFADQRSSRRAFLVDNHGSGSSRPFSRRVLDPGQRGDQDLGCVGVHEGLPASLDEKSLEDVP